MRTRNILYFQEKIGFHPFILKSKKKKKCFVSKEVISTKKQNEFVKDKSISSMCAILASSTLV